MAETKRKRSKAEASFGNVFADLGLPDADERQIKVQLAVAINRELTAREWSQSRAAEALGVCYWLCKRALIWRHEVSPRVCVVGWPVMMFPTSPPRPTSL